LRGPWLCRAVVGITYRLSAIAPMDALVIRGRGGIMDVGRGPRWHAANHMRPKIPASEPPALRSDRPEG
jgi:hypothetical protein